MIGLAFAGIWADKRGRKEPQQAGCLLIIAGAREYNSVPVCRCVNCPLHALHGRMM